MCSVSGTLIEKIQFININCLTLKEYTVIYVWFLIFKTSFKLQTSAF